MPRFDDEDITMRRMAGKRFVSGGKQVIPAARPVAEVARVAPKPEPQVNVAQDALVLAAQSSVMAAQAAAESAALSRAAAEEVAAGVVDLASAIREKKRWRCVVGRDKEGRISHVDINQG